MQPRVFQQIPSYDLAGHDLVADMLRSDHQDHRKDRQDRPDVKLRQLEIGQREKRRLCHLREVHDPTEQSGDISRDDCDQDRDHRQKSLEHNISEHSHA